MAAPWAGFGAFLFDRSERPIEGSDTYWTVKPTYARSRPLGSAKDSILTLAVGSGERSMQMRLSPARFATLAALVSTIGTFTDWNRPIPDSRLATLMTVSRVGVVWGPCPDTNKTVELWVTQVELVSQ